MKTFLIGLLILLVIIIIIVAIIASMYNKLVKERNKVANGWSQIDVQLKRRFDLIPNLVETTKGYASHEKGIFEEFAKARNSYNQAAQANDIGAISEANTMFSSALSRLLAISEAYPELKADKHFNNLLHNLRETEDKIAFSRQFYNDVVLTYNNLTEVFPMNMLAKAFNFQKAEFFKTHEVERENVKVQF